MGESLVNINWEVLVGQLGFGILIFALYTFLLRWVLKQQEKILDNAKEERVSWQTIIGKFNDDIREHTQSAQELRRQMSEAHKYQREEHQKIMLQGETSCTLLTEATTLLKTLNGKKSS